MRVLSRRFLVATGDHEMVVEVLERFLSRSWLRWFGVFEYRPVCRRYLKFHESSLEWYVDVGSHFKKCGASLCLDLADLWEQAEMNARHGQADLEVRTVEDNAAAKDGGKGGPREPVRAPCRREP